MYAWSRTATSLQANSIICRVNLWLPGYGLELRVFCLVFIWNAVVIKLKKTHAYWVQGIREFGFTRRPEILVVVYLSSIIPKIDIKVSKTCGYLVKKRNKILLHRHIFFLPADADKSHGCQLLQHDFLDIDDVAFLSRPIARSDNEEDGIDGNSSGETVVKELLIEDQDSVARLLLL